jgi:hypothetical protein
MRRRLAFSVLIGVFAAAALAVVAAAGPPDHFTDSVDYSYLDPGAGQTHCNGFDDLYEGHFDVSGITKFDQNGNPVEDVVHISGWERNWRSDRPSVSILAKREFNINYYYATDTEKDNGIIYQQTAPGHGVLFHDVGSIIIDHTTGEPIAVHGPHDVFENGDQTFCNALLAVS